MYIANEQRYNAMQYRRSGKSGVKLPLISLGLWHNFGGVDTFENGRAMVRRAFDLGITHFDLANNYGPPPGSAESNFGEILRLDGVNVRGVIVRACADEWRQRAECQDRCETSLLVGHCMFPGAVPRDCYRERRNPCRKC